MSSSLDANVGRSRLIAGILFTTAGLTIALFIFLSTPTLSISHPLLWMAVFGSGLVGIGSFLITTDRLRSLDELRVFRFGPLFAIYYTLVFGIFSIGWLSPQTGSASLISPSAVASSVGLITIGLSFWTFGYSFGLPTIFRRATSATVDFIFPGYDWTLRFPTVPIFIYFIGTLARLYQLLTGQYGYLQNASAALSSPSSTGHLLSVLTDFCQLGLILSALDAFTISKSFRSKLIFRVLFIIEILNGLYSGNKQEIIVPILTILITIIYSFKRVSKKSMVFSILALLIIFPLITSYRSAIRNSSTIVVSNSTAANSLPTVIMSTFSGLTPREMFINSPSLIASRLREIDNIAIIRQKTPSSIAYKSWTHLIEGPAVGWIPRAIWPSKPILSTGQTFSEEYYDIPPTLLTASAITTPGYLYQHGGIIPLFIGMFIIGALMQTFDVEINPTKDHRRLLLFIPLLTTLIKFESDTTNLILSIFTLFFVVWLVSRISIRSQSRTI